MNDLAFSSARASRKAYKAKRGRGNRGEQASEGDSPLQLAGKVASAWYVGWTARRPTTGEEGLELRCRGEGERERERDCLATFSSSWLPAGGRRTLSDWRRRARAKEEGGSGRAG